jgi:hypothetical protein
LKQENEELVAGMMIGFLIAAILLGSVLAIGAGVWQVHLLMRKVALLERQQQSLGHLSHVDLDDASVQVLSQQVNELHQAMGGVVKGLQTMSRQVYTLNKLAGQVMQGDPHMAAQQIMLQVQPAEEQQQPNFEDLPEDVQTKMRAFQALHMALIENGEFRSRKRPDLN